MILLQSIIAFILVLGPLVFVHEFGHFIVAKMLRIGVPVFSLGFGPRLFGFRRGGTDYRISAIPLGGYVRLAGDEADENRRGLPEEFLSRPKWQRFLVFVAGATFNVITAFVAFWVLFAVYGRDEVPNPDAYPSIRAIAEDSEAQRAGLVAGDTLIEISGRDVWGVDTFNEIYGIEIALSPNKTRELLIERDGERRTVEIDVQADPVYGHGANPGWSLSWGGAPLIAQIVEDGPAAAAGVLPGDTIVAAEDQEPIGEIALRQLIEASPGRELTFKIDREGQVLDLRIRPRDENGVGKIGVMFGLVHRELSLAEAARESVSENLANSLMLFQVLKKLFTRDVPLKSVSGPIGIAKVARDAMLTSPRHFLWLLGFFSLQLGILNLLPIPVLDGGHILILTIEGVIRRELSDKLKERVMQAGFVFLLAFMSLVIFMDFQKIWP